MQNGYFGPAITNDGQILIKIGSLYDVYHCNKNDKSLIKSGHRNFQSTILILGIEKRIKGRSWSPTPFLPNEHKIKFLSLIDNKIKTMYWSSGDLDANFYFKEILE